ncbi:hypothetical protein C0993_004543 [Termitomyces sp. T159_Od127]|nr:hypothetical protein C0993_004543 [Termitomyces sp. T159_Od127]
MVKEAVIASFVEQDLQCQDKFWQEIAKELEADVQQCITSSLEALAWEGLGLKEATGTGKELQQGQGEGEGAKEKTPETMAGTARRAAMPTAMKAPMGGAKRLALPTKKSSPTKPFFKRRGCQAPQYKVPTQQDFSNKELACPLALRQAEVVVDTGVEAGVVLKETKEKAMVDFAMCQTFKEEQRACDKCWVDNDSEGCWYPIGTSPCFRCAAMKRLCNLGWCQDAQMRTILVRRVQKVMERAREVEARGEAVAISKRSLALLTHQDKEGREGSKGKRKAFPPLLPIKKEKKRVRVVLPAVVTPKVESEEEEEEDEAHRLAMVIEASKAALGGDDLAGSSHQAEMPQDVGDWQEDKGQEQEVEVRLEATPQAQPWGEELPQWM